MVDDVMPHPIPDRRLLAVECCDAPLVPIIVVPTSDVDMWLAVYDCEACCRVRVTRWLWLDDPGKRHEEVRW